MRKARSKKLAIMILFTFMATLFAAVPMASAATNYDSVTAIPKFDPATDAAKQLDLATVNIKIDPSFGGHSSALVEVVDASGERLTINKVYQTSDCPAVQFNPVAGTDDLTYRLDVKSRSGGAKSQIQLDINVDAKNAATGDIKVVFSAATGELKNGEEIVATATGGSVEAAVLTIPAFGDAGGVVKVRLTESSAGAMNVATDSVKLKLPNGFEWQNVQANILQGTTKDGGVLRNIDNTDIKLHPDGRDLEIELKRSTVGTKLIVDITATSNNNNVKVDTTTARAGDVIVDVSGDSTVTPSELTVATFGDYEVEVSSFSTTEVNPGQYEQELGKIALEEQLPQTLTANRTIMLTLPDKAKFTSMPSIDTGNSKNFVDNIGTFSLVGTDRRVAKATLSDFISSGTKAATVVIKGGKVTLAADFEGDVIMEVSGSAGALGEAKVAEAKLPVVATPASEPQITIGVQNQVAADVTITESVKEALNHKYDTCTDVDKDNIVLDKTSRDARLMLELPMGVRFASTPSIEVTEGDVQIGVVETDVDSRRASVRIKGTSSKASTLEITDMKVIADRTVPEGPINLKIGGEALVENNTKDFFPDVNWATTVVIGKCITPAPTDKKATAVFTIGETTYALNGEEATMDVAPYIKNDRTFLPVRFVSNAVGVANENIYWNDATKTVTIIKGERAVQMTIGSKIMKINGAEIAIDVAPEIKADRTMLPIRALSTALGCEILWDDATRTVTINY